eukprot:jgi/Tetstr1/462198/TSEL_007261.t1
MSQAPVTLSAKHRTYVIDEPEAVAPWAASLRSRLQDAFGSDELGQRTLDLLSSSLTAQTLKSYAGNMSQFAEFCHDSENISPPEATTPSVIRPLVKMAGVVPSDGSVVKLKGMPFKAGKADVLAFFDGFKLAGEQCLIRKNPDGRINGEALVIFDSPEEANRATAKDREVFGPQLYGDRFVRVYPLLDNDLADIKNIAIAGEFYSINAPGKHSATETVVRVRGLPMDAKQLDVITFFKDYALRANGVQVLVTSGLKPVGEAFVDFETCEDAQKACAEKDHKVFDEEKFGDRFVRLILVPRREMQDALGSHLGGDGIIKVKGMPFKATHAEVRQFFSGHAIKPNGISIVMQPDGRSSGMAFVEFESSTEALAAMKKDRAKFGPAHGDRFVILQVATKQDMSGMQLQREGDANMMMGMGGMGRSSMGMGMGMGMGMNMGMGMQSPMGGGMAGPMGGMAGPMGGMQPSMGGMPRPMAPGSMGMQSPMGGGANPGAMTPGMGDAMPPGGPMGGGTPGWQAMMDPGTGVVFYQNMTTGERSWTDPMWNNAKA